MAATLANGGVNPTTGETVIGPGVCRRVLAVMASAGLYELLGDWLYQIGVPGKSGVSGGIVTVAPGKGGLATYSPPLDAAGNSVRGQLATKYLAERLGLNLFASVPAEGAPPQMAAYSRESCQVATDHHVVAEVALALHADLSRPWRSRRFRGGRCVQMRCSPTVSNPKRSSAAAASVA